MKYSLLLFVLIYQFCYSQDLKSVKLIKEEVNKEIQYHFEWESTGGHFAGIELLLFKNRTFKYAIESNVYNAWSTGYWSQSKDIITLNSNFQAGVLPIEISYRKRDSLDHDVKRIAFVRDLNNKPMPYAFVYINNDSTSCMDGDAMCIGEYEQIDSIKVVLANKGPSSKWMQVPSFEGLLQLTIPTKENLEHYIMITVKRYRLKNGKLIKISD